MKRLLLLLCTIFYLPAFVPAPTPSQERKLPTFKQLIEQEEVRQNKMRDDEELHQKMIKEEEERQLQERRQAIAKRRENLEKQKADVEEQRKKVAALEKQNIARKLEKSAQQSQAKKSQEPVEPGQKLVEREKVLSKGLNDLPGDLKREILLINAKIGPVLNIPGIAREILNIAGINKAFRDAINEPRNMLVILKSLPKAGALYLAEKLAQMPVIKSEEVQKWLGSIRDRLEGGRELFDVISSENPDPRRVAVLLENPYIEVNWKSRNGSTALSKAVLKNNQRIVSLLVAAGANVNAKDISSKTALMWASEKGHAKIVELLIAAGANVNTKDKDGQTALMRACYGNHAQIVKLLLVAGADVNIQEDLFGYTALMIAAKEILGKKVVKLLIAAGANIYAEDKNNKTARMLADQRGNFQTAVLLEDAEKTQKEKATGK
jgi:hypothetical protein